MSYLQTRVSNFNKFKKMIDHPDSKQCGPEFQLVDLDRSPFLPRLRYLGSGSYGIAFVVEHPRLSDKNIEVVMKVANSIKPYTYHGNTVHVRDNEALQEIYYNLFFSKLVENGITYHFPLFSNCKSNPAHAMLDTTKRLINDCDCGPTSITGGCSFAFNLNKQLSQENFNKVNQHDNQHIIRLLQHGCLLSFSEKYDGDFDSYLSNIIQTSDEMIMKEIDQQRKDLIHNQTDIHMLEQIMTSTVQMIFAFNEMHKHNFSHCDTHGGNILYKNLDDVYSFVYGYTDDDGNEIVLTSPSDKLFVLADFGFTGRKKIGGVASHIPSKITSQFLDSLKNTWWDRDTRNKMKGADYSKWKRSVLYDLYRFMIALSYGINHPTSDHPNMIKYYNTATFVSNVLVFLYNKLKELELYPLQQADYDPLQFFNDIPSVLTKGSQILSMWNTIAARKKKCDKCDTYNKIDDQKCSGCGKSLCKGGVCKRVTESIKNIKKAIFGIRPKKKSMRARKIKK